MRKLFAAATLVALCAASALAQSTQAPTLRIVSEDGNRLPSDLIYGNTRVKPLRLRPGTNTPITIDDADFFVQQQYVDFLSRFPDSSGFVFWQGQINECQTAQCREVRRINVSAAFFRSIEFQETGLFVYNAYKAAFGDLTGRPVPVRRETFMPETRGLANGVVVGVGEWRQQLDANKTAYARAFVQRGDFVSKYPTTLSAAAFVDALFATAGVTPSAADRQNALNAYNAGADAVSSRAAALRSVVESGSLTAAEFNKAFVLMQYFGYLKRNPDDLPDANFDGYRFWLKKLNDFGGDFVRAEMVKAFLASDEYRSRF